MFQSAARHFESNSTDDRFSAYVPELYLEWGGALAESNRGSDAVAVLQKGVDRLDVENRDSLTLARLHNNVGLAHLACDDNEKALSAFAMAETVLDRLEDATSPEDSAMLTEIAFERALVVLNQSQIHRLNREWDAGIDVLSRAASALEARTQSDARLADDEEFVRVLGLLYRNLGMMQLPRVGPLETVRTLSKSESLLSRLPTNSAPDQVSLAQCLSSLALAELMAHETGAEAHAKRAISIFEKLQEDKVAIAHLDGELASACLALGMEKLMRFEDEEAMGWFDKAAVHGERNYENDQSQQTRRNLLGVYHGRSLALTRLLRFDAAVDDLTKALQIAERESPVYVWLPVQLQVSRAGTDEYQDALKQLPSVLEGLEVPAAQDYMAACAYAAASRKASVDRRIIEQERSARAEEYAIQAVEFLSKAQKAGYFAKESDSPGVKPLHEDSLFALLRDRPDFQGLLKGVSLLWRLEKGKIVRFRATMNQRATIDAQKEIVTRAIYDVTWKVEMVDDEGIANVTVTIDRVRSQRLSGDKVEDEFDSKTGKRFRGLQGVTLNYMLSQYVGSTVKFRMAPTGQKTHFTWSGPIDELNVPGVQGTDLKAVLAGVLFRDVSVSSVPLPPGESWRCEIGEQTEDIFALADGKCVFDGVIANGDSRMAKITFQLRRPNDQAEGGGSMTFDEFEGEGEQLMDLDSGLLDRFVVHKMAAFRMRKDGETHSARTDNSVMIEKVEPDAEE
jgi:tetratricopeptide (TPR) repeat protein